MNIASEVLAGIPISCEVIDAHTHITPYTNTGWYQYQPELSTLIHDMDRYGVNTIVTAPHALVGSYSEEANSITVAAMKEYPGRILGYVCFNPEYGLAETKSIVKKYWGKPGFVGFKFLSGYHGSLLSEPYAYALSVANEHHAPVLCHTWANSPPFSEFRTVAKKYPKLSLIAGHGGGSRSTYKDAIAACKDHSNLFIEICGGLYCDWWLEDIVADAGAERVIYGTDAINLDMRYDLGRVVFADLPESDKKKILAVNFKKILAKIRF